MIIYSVQKRSSKTFEVMSHLIDEDTLKPFTNNIFCKTDKEGHANLIKYLLQNHEIKTHPELKEKIEAYRN